MRQLREFRVKVQHIVPGRAAVLGWLLVVGVSLPPAAAIQITLDYTLDEQNENWFSPNSAEGLARRGAVGAAAEFLSTILANDDWQPLDSLVEQITFTDIRASTIRGLSGNLLVGTPESDGEGYAYTGSSNNVDITNRDSIGANEYVVYVGAFAFDDGSTANAKGGADSADRRNTAGVLGTEFNTWGGKIYFNTQKDWYAGSPAGIDPTDNYGVQDPNKNPSFDTSTDNWDWSTTSDSWKGFQLQTIDPSAAGRRDLYATAMHELMHALGATTTPIINYVGVDSGGDFIGENLVAEYGGPVPGSGGHFETNVQSVVWGSEDILSEVVLDPNSLSGVRKYFTRLDAALLRDLGYDVLTDFAEPFLAGDFNDDGLIDAADYTLWRDELNTSTNLSNDNTPGAVTSGDRGDWAAAYAAASPSSSISAPEPSGVILSLAAIGLGWPTRRS